MILDALGEPAEIVYSMLLLLEQDGEAFRILDNKWRRA